MSQQPTRVLRSLAVAVACSAGILGLAAAPAVAQACYPPGPNCVVTTRPGGTATITISDTTAGRGKSIVVTLTGFKSGEVIVIQIRSTPQTLGTVTADGQDRATRSVTIPADIQLGRHDIAAMGVGTSSQPVDIKTRITIVADQAANAGVLGASAANESGTSGTGGSLAKTGATFVVPTAAAGLALVGSGVLLRRTVKRRKPVPA